MDDVQVLMLQDFFSWQISSSY